MVLVTNNRYVEAQSEGDKVENILINVVKIKEVGKVGSKVENAKSIVMDGATIGRSWKTDNSDIDEERRHRDKSQSSDCWQALA